MSADYLYSEREQGEASPACRLGVVGISRQPFSHHFKTLKARSALTRADEHSENLRSTPLGVLLATGRKGKKQGLQVPRDTFTPYCRSTET
eukprot:scaffold91225_cov27-Tisochrysis_lutea.AAC.1